MDNTTTAVEPYQQRPLTPAPAFDFAPKSLDEAFRLCEILADSELVPKDYQRKPGNCMVAIQWGAELGLKPLQAMQNIAVINGRPSLWGDAVLALVRSSPWCEYVLEDWDDNGTAICRAKRRGEPEQVRTFSIDDQKAAGLFGKSGPHTQYPKRMRQLRARGFALRDVFADVLKGIPMAEELVDYSPATDQIPRNAAPAQIAAAAAPKAERTETHQKLIDELEHLAFKQGTEAFRKAWEALTPAERTAIGIAERDRIKAIGAETDQHVAAGVKP